MSKPWLEMQDAGIQPGKYLMADMYHVCMYVHRDVENRRGLIIEFVHMIYLISYIVHVCM
jgi:hypothetical protein